MFIYEFLICLTFCVLVRSDDVQQEGNVRVKKDIAEQKEQSTFRWTPTTPPVISVNDLNYKIETLKNALLKCCSKHAKSHAEHTCYRKYHGDCSCNRRGGRCNTCGRYYRRREYDSYSSDSSSSDCYCRYGRFHRYPGPVSCSHSSYSSDSSSSSGSSSCRRPEHRIPVFKCNCKKAVILKSKKDSSSSSSSSSSCSCDRCRSSSSSSSSCSCDSS